MSRFRFDPTDRLTLRGVPMRCERTEEGGHLFLRLDFPSDGAELLTSMTHDELAAVMESGDFRYEPRFFAPGRAEARLHSGVDGWVDLPKREHPRTMVRVFWAERFLEMERGQREGPRRPMAQRISRSARGLTRAMDQVEAAVKAARAKRLEEACEGKPRKPQVDSPESPALPDLPLRRPCTKTLLSWVRAYESVGGAERTRLRDRKRNSGRGRGPRLDLEVEAVMALFVDRYASESRPTKAALYLSFEAELSRRDAAQAPDAPRMELPALKTFSRRIAALDQFRVCVAREGLKVARHRFGPLTLGFTATRVGEVVMLDMWQVSIHVLFVTTGLWEHMPEAQRAKVKRIRPWVCMAIDAASRAVLGMAISLTQTSDTVVEVLRMVVSDKGRYSDAVGALSTWSQCVYPESIMTDAGSDFTSDKVQGTIAGLGIPNMTGPGGVPTLRSIMERLFGTVDTKLLSRFTGRTFANVVEKGDYDSEARAMLDLDDLCTVLTRFMVDQYHNTPHGGLDGETPAAAFERLQELYDPRPLPDPCRMASVFGLETAATVDRGGVCVLRLSFQSKRLQDHFRQHGVCKVPVRVYPEDMRGVSVMIGGDWHWCACRTLVVQGVTMQQWVAAAGSLKKRFPGKAAPSHEAVLAAVRSFDDLAVRNLARFGLGDVRPDEEFLRRAERNLNMSWTMPGMDVVGPEDADLMSGAVEGTCVEVFPQPALPAPAPAAVGEADAPKARAPRAKKAVIAVKTPVAPVDRATPSRTGRRPGPPPRRHAKPGGPDRAVRKG